MSMQPAYAELQVTSNFSFLRGASHPEEMVHQAHALGLAGISITDRNSLAGIVRAHVEAKALGLRFIVGCRIDLVDSPSFLCWPVDRPAYARLSSLLSTGRQRAPKGACELHLDDLLAASEGMLLAVIPPLEKERSLRQSLHDPAFVRLLARLARELPERLWIVANCPLIGGDQAYLDELAALARSVDLPLLAANDVHYHVMERRQLHDVVTCIREHCTIHDAGFRKLSNGERHLKSPDEMARLFRDHPAALSASLDIIGRCRFSLDDLAYDYPVAESYDGRTPQQELERRTWLGAQARYGDALPEKIRRLLAHELSLIGRLDYAPYFLTVHDIVLFARSRDILCQGRGSAANSAVCYVLGITAIDPDRMDLLFERFVSEERHEPPDIDVDFEHERREEVIQWILETYGRDHAALVATVIRYRPRSALREVAKVLGLPRDVQDALSKMIWVQSSDGPSLAAGTKMNVDMKAPPVQMTLQLAHQLQNFPRHLSQHPGGFVIAKSPLRELVPIENAAMKNRTVIQWDKDDADALHMMKVDVLALGMLSALRRGFALLRSHYGIDLDLAQVPVEDRAVYRMLSEADSIGVFQVESRAQMSMLPRLKPKTFYDLVIEVAIVRPGPIQGEMVHPYLRRRDGLEEPVYPTEALRGVLEKTMGVPLFQEQAMRVAIECAGFTPTQADQLRKSMATFKLTGKVSYFKDKLITGMVKNGYEQDFAERTFRQIEGFGSYGFPESHAASFALLVYISAWLKCHYPDVFCAALLNSQPMGFYAPAQLVQDAQQHGVEVRAVDVNHSDWDCTLEPLGRRGPLKTALRLGMRLVRGLRNKEVLRLTTARLKPYRTPEEIKRRAGIQRETLIALAEADAFRSMGMDRRQALWAVQAVGVSSLPLFDAADATEGANMRSVDGGDEPWLELPRMTLGEHVIEDYSRLRLSLKAHPLALLRDGLASRKITPAAQLSRIQPGRRVTVCGLVLVRQRPGSAKGIMFATLEDETGFINIVCWQNIYEKYRAIVMTSRLMAAYGRLQREGPVIHIVVEQLSDMSHELQRLKEDEATRYTKEINPASTQHEVNIDNTDSNVCI